VIQPSALNLIIVAAMMVIIIFMMRMLAASLVTRNPDSGVGKALGAIFS
jgi:hypothetical protein